MIYTVPGSQAVSAEYDKHLTVGNEAIVIVSLVKYQALVAKSIADRSCGRRSKYVSYFSAARLSAKDRRIHALLRREGEKAMAARAYWKGQIRLALVSIPVEIYSVTKSGAAVTFRQIHEPSGKPVKYEKIVPGIGAINHDEIVKGFELSKGNYVLLDKEEIERVKLESKRTLELVQFVDTDAIDVLYYTKPYYVVPADELAEEAYIVLREALKRTMKVGLGQLALRGRIAPPSRASGYGTRRRRRSAAGAPSFVNRQAFPIQTPAAGRSTHRYACNLALWLAGRGA